MDINKLNDLRVDPNRKRRPQRSIWTIFGVVFGLTALAVFFAWPRASDKTRIFQREEGVAAPATRVASAAESSGSRADVPARTDQEVGLTVRALSMTLFAHAHDGGPT